MDDIISQGNSGREINLPIPFFLINKFADQRKSTTRKKKYHHSNIHDRIHSQVHPKSVHQNEYLRNTIEYKNRRT